MNPSVSVIIPVKNGAATLDKCLYAIYKQTISSLLEVILIDSGSTDNSLEIASKYPVKIINLSPGLFNHGLTRNLGVQNACAPLVYFTVQDAWIAEKDMLEKMKLHFEDETVLSVCGMQAVPRQNNTNPAAWFNRQTKPEIEIRCFEKGGYQLLDNAQKLKYARWDDVNSLYRKNALISSPFRETDFAEDVIWATEILAESGKLIYDPSMVVYHYHHQDFSYAFRSSYIVHFCFYNIFHVLPVYPSFTMNCSRAIRRVVRLRGYSLRKKFYWIFHNISSQFAFLISVFIFRITRLIGGDKSIKKSVQLFCKTIPQGNLKMFHRSPKIKEYGG